MEKISLHINHIPSDMTEEEVRETFSQFGNVIDVYFPKDLHTKLRKGFGFVAFDTMSSAKAAVEAMNGHIFKEGSRPLLCELAKHGKKSKEEMIQSERGGRDYRRDNREREEPRSRRRRSRSPPPSRNHQRRGRERSRDRRSRRDPSPHPPSSSSGRKRSPSRRE